MVKITAPQKKQINKQTKKIKANEPESSNSDSSSSNSDSSSDSDSDYVDEISSKKSKTEYTKFLSKMFPSKYMSKKVNDEKTIQEQPIQEKLTKKEKNELSKNSRAVSNKKQRSIKDEDDDEDEDEEEEDKSSKLSKSVNIFLTVDETGGSEWDDEGSEYEDEDVDDSIDEDEDVSVSSEENDEDDEEEESIVNDKVEPLKNDKTSELLKTLLSFQSMNKNNKVIEDCVEACKGSIQKINHKLVQKENKQKEKNQRIFKKMVYNKKLLSEVAYFKKLEFESQKKIIKEMRSVNKIISIEKPYRLSLLESNIPISHKSTAMKKINLLKSMDPNCSEYYKIKHWVDSFMRIPFGEISKLDVNITDGVEASHSFMENAKQILDTAVYGLNDAKIQIMQMLGQFITNPNALGCAIAIKGPPGTGKTSLVKEGISKILNRPFAFIALGGATDSSFLDGHSYTYEGSIWGKIVQILMDSKCMNPVIYFDELDKISETPKGDEIVGILTHLTDVSQNSQFHDKYFSELDFDLSKCLFIFSYNDESKINPILRDRMYRIQTNGYDKKQKNIIATQYLLPKIQEQVKFEKDAIIISDDVHNYIVENYCEKEDGVRNQKRCLEIIYTKLNLYRLMRPGSKLFESDMVEVSFPFTVTKPIVDKLITSSKKDNMYFKSLYV